MVSEHWELMYLHDGRKGNSLRAVSCAVLWLCAQFPCCVAVLGTSGHIVLVPNQLQQVSQFNYISQLTSGAYGPVIASPCEVSDQCDFLTQRQTYSGPWVSSAFLYPLTNARKPFRFPSRPHQVHKERGADRGPSTWTPLSQFRITSRRVPRGPSTTMNMEKR